MIKPPSIWNSGILLSNSGVDSDADERYQVVGKPMDPRTGIGMILHSDGQRMLRCDCLRCVNSLRIVKAEVFSDAVRLQVQLSPGAPLGDVYFIFAATGLVIGQVPEELPIRLEKARGLRAKARQAGDALFLPSRGESAVLAATRRAGGTVKFACALGRQREEKVLARARAALAMDVPRAFAERKAFYSILPPPARCPAPLNELFTKSVSVLKVNALAPNRFTPYAHSTPDRWPHRWVWIWDSVFHALGYRHFPGSLAADNLLAVLHHQRKDGFIPHYMQDRAAPSVTTQPPILSWGALEVYRVKRDKEFLAGAFDGLQKHLLWCLRNRDRNHNGLLEWQLQSVNPFCPCGEGGQDNSPYFDGADERTLIDVADFSSFFANDVCCLEEIGQIVGRRASPLLSRAARRAEELVRRRLWDRRDGFFYPRDSAGRFIRIKQYAGFVPLFAGIATPAQAKALVRHLTDPREFWTRCPVPSAAIDEPCFTPDYWRGGTWLNYTYLIYLGLRRYGYHAVARRLARRCLAQVLRDYQRDGCLFEFYDPMGNVSPNRLPQINLYRTSGREDAPGAVPDYNWSAAVTLQWILDLHSSHSKGSR